MPLFLKGKTSPASSRVEQCLQDFGLYNTFNPSIIERDGRVFIAFRAARDPSDRPFRAFYTVIDAGSAAPPLDLGEAFAAAQLKSVSDPKLFGLGDEIWVTVNTGHYEEPNRIFVMRLHPTPSAPIEARFAERNKIEKNWGFFRVGDELYCLYGINPLIVLRCQDREAPAWEFERFDGGTVPRRSDVPSLTIGPQPVLTRTESGPVLRLIAHQKFMLRNRRAYLGRAVEICLDPAPRIISVGPLLGHSWLALLGSRLRHNRNLISCTYFSGLSMTGDRALLGYGINDTNFALADIAAREIGFSTVASP